MGAKPVEFAVRGKCGSLLPKRCKNATCCKSLQGQSDVSAVKGWKNAWCVAHVQNGLGWKSVRGVASGQRPATAPTALAAALGVKRTASGRRLAASGRACCDCC